MPTEKLANICINFMALGAATGTHPLDVAHEYSVLLFPLSTEARSLFYNDCATYLRQHHSEGAYTIH